MQAGYRREPELLAKDLKIAKKNSKRDKVLYGAVIKTDFDVSTKPPKTSAVEPTKITIGQTENLYNSLISTSSTQTPPSDPGASTAATLTSTRSTAPLTVDTSSQGVTIGPSEVLYNTSSVTTVPSIGTQTEGSLSELYNEIPSVEQIAIKKKFMLAMEELLKNNEIKKNNQISMINRLIELIDKNKMQEALDKLEENRKLVNNEYVKKVKRNLKALLIEKRLNKRIKDKQAQTELNPVDSRESNVSVASPTPQSTGDRSYAPTTASTTDLEVPLEESKADTQEDKEKDKPESIVDNSTQIGTYVQNSADKIFKDLNKIKEEYATNKNKSFKPSQSVSITPYKRDKTVYGNNVRMYINKKRNGFYTFTVRAKTSRTLPDRETNSMTINTFPIKDSELSVPLSLTLALGRISAGEYDPSAKVGATTGLGIGDTEGIKSERVVYAMRKDGKYIKKGQLYVLEPQLMRGHVRLYNKSGHPVVSRSNASPSFQRLVQDIVERNTFEPDDYSSVDPKESADVNEFIKATKPMKPRGINRLANADAVWQLKKRYEVLVGELAAGNSGKLVRDEMETILRSLIRLHAMSEIKGRDLIKSLREF